MDTGIVLQQMCVIAVLVLIGYLLYARRVIDHSFMKQLSVLVADFTNPATILATILTGQIVATQKEVLTALVIAFVIYAILCVLGLLIPYCLGVERSEHRFYNLMTVYTNTGFMGIPLARAILPENAMIYVVIFNIMFSVYMYTHGVIVLGGREQIRLRKILNPGTVMALVTLVIYWFRIPVPTVPANILIYLGNATTFLTMTLLGASIAQQSIRKSLRSRPVWRFIGLRMLLIPLIGTILLKRVVSNDDMIIAYCLMLALPTANMPLILAEKEGYPTEVLARGTLMTTLVSFVTISVLLGVLF